MRRVLFDEDVPKQLRRDLREFEIRTVQEESWTSIKNGDLLRRASGSFDVLVTADRRLQHQQNIAQFAIGVVVLATGDVRLPSLRSRLDQVREAIMNVEPGVIRLVNAE